MSYSHVERAQVLAEALPYIQKYNGKTVVVKYGGNAMISDELRQAVISDIILLHLVGVRVVVVHGGGPEITEMLKKIGKESQFVDGLRYTDQETMDIVQQVLCGKVNKNLVATLNRLGGKGYDEINTRCTLLVVGENPGKGQMDKAARWNKPTITWEEWWERAFGFPAVTKPETEAEEKPEAETQPEKEAESILTLDQFAAIVEHAV